MRHIGDCPGLPCLCILCLGGHNPNKLCIAEPCESCNGKHPPGVCFLENDSTEGDEAKIVLKKVSSCAFCRQSAEQSAMKEYVKDHLTKEHKCGLCGGEGHTYAMGVANCGDASFSGIKKVQILLSHAMENHSENPSNADSIKRWTDFLQFLAEKEKADSSTEDTMFDFSDRKSWPSLRDEMVSTSTSVEYPASAVTPEEEPTTSTATEAADTVKTVASVLTFVGAAAEAMSPSPGEQQFIFVATASATSADADILTPVVEGAEVAASAIASAIIAAIAEAKVVEPSTTPTAEDVVVFAKSVADTPPGLFPEYTFVAEDVKTLTPVVEDEAAKVAKAVADAASAIATAITAAIAEAKVIKTQPPTLYYIFAEFEDCYGPEFSKVGEKWGG